MKKVFLVSCSFAFFIACTSNTDSKDVSADTEAAASSAGEDMTNNPDYQQGLEIMAKNDCGVCHQVKEKGIGPSLHEIAVRYAEADETKIDSLANKVISGGYGNWGTVPMTEHKNLSKEEAKTVVRYILLLKNM